MFIFLFLLILFLPFAFLGDEKCMGKSDVFFIIDMSSSINDYEFYIFMKSCKAIIEAFENISEDGVHVSVIEFHASSSVLIELTGDREDILEKFDHWLDGCDTNYHTEGCSSDKCPNRPACYGTKYAEGFNTAYGEFSSPRKRENVQSIVFFFYRWSTKQRQML